MKKVVSKTKSKVKKTKLDEAHVTELLTQWQMPFSIVAKNQGVSEKVVKEFAVRLVKQKRLSHKLLEQLSH